MPGNRTPGMCRDEQKMPSKSQMALALECWLKLVQIRQNQRYDTRIRIDLVEKATTVFPIEDAGEAPGLLLHGLNICDFNHKDVAWLRGFNLERS